MIRLLVALGLLIAGTLPIAPATAERIASPIDQASWNGRKRHVRLPNGIRLAYVEIGNPSGRPLLLLHGYTDSSRVWTILAPWLQDHRILIPDQRGHGASEVPQCCYAMSDLAEDVRLFLDAIGWRRPMISVHIQSLRRTGALAVDPMRATRLTRSGCSAASSCATMLPIEWPATAACSTPIASRNRRASSARSDIA